jgi:hypothetical protein
MFGGLMEAHDRPVEVAKVKLLNLDGTSSHFGWLLCKYI